MIEVIAEPLAMKKSRRAEIIQGVLD